MPWLLMLLLLLPAIASGQLTLREGLGRALTHAEMDNNFLFLQALSTVLISTNGCHVDHPGAVSGQMCRLAVQEDDETLWELYICNGDCSAPWEKIGGVPGEIFGLGFVVSNDSCEIDALDSDEPFCVQVTNGEALQTTLFYRCNSDESAWCAVSGSGSTSLSDAFLAGNIIGPLTEEFPLILAPVGGMEQGHCRFYQKEGNWHLGECYDSQGNRMNPGFNLDEGMSFVGKGTLPNQSQVTLFEVAAVGEGLITLGAFLKLPPIFGDPPENECQIEDHRGKLLQTQDPNDIWVCWGREEIDAIFEWRSLLTVVSAPPLQSVANAGRDVGDAVDVGAAVRIGKITGDPAIDTYHEFYAGATGPVHRYVCPGNEACQKIEILPQIVGQQRTALFYLSEAKADDDNLLAWVFSHSDVTVLNIRCNYEGSAPTTVAQPQLVGMTHSAPTCAGPTAKATPQDVTAGGFVEAGMPIRLSIVNSPNPTTDNYLIAITVRLE